MESWETLIVFSEPMTVSEIGSIISQDNKVGYVLDANANYCLPNVFGFNPSSDPVLKFTFINKVDFDKAQSLLLEALSTDGLDHKQWCLHEIANLLGVNYDKDDYLEGRAP